MTPAQTIIISIFAFLAAAISVSYIDKDRIMKAFDKIKAFFDKARKRVFRKKKRRFDLYVHGNLISNGYCAFMNKPAGIEEHVPYDEVDLKHGIIIEGNMEVSNLYKTNKMVGASGYISARGPLTEEQQSIYSDSFISASNKRK